MANAWILTTDKRIVNPVKAVAAIGGTTTVIAVVPSAPAVGGVDTIIYVPTTENVPAEAYAGVTVELLADAKGDMILVANRPVERSFAGVAVTALALPVVVGATSVSARGAEVTRHGGLTNETVAFKGVVFIFGGGATPKASGPAARAHGGAPTDAVVIDVQPIGSGPANPVAARRIASCGHGFKAEEGPGLARTLAEALGTEIVCSRPLTEDTARLSKDRYVGVSGIHVVSDVYVALGTSGQVQHTPGIADSKVAITVNNDASAPIFRIPDYGIVGGIYDVAPALTAALS